MLHFVSKRRKVNNIYILNGKIKDLSFDFKTDKAVLTLILDEKQSAMNMYDELNEAEKITVKIDKYRKKRSLDANAYCFVLIGKIAEKTGISKEDIYKQAIKEIGGNYEVVCVQNRAVEKLCRSWELNGLGWQTDTMPSKIEGCTNVLLYYGSSTYDTAQMTRLIDNIIQDCEALGIDTKTPDEIANLLSLWGE